MSTLIVGLDNPDRAQPTNALLPYPEGSTGHLLFVLIRDQLQGHYSTLQFVADFKRTHLYSNGRAPNGRGRRERDLQAFGSLLQLCDALKIEDVVLLGSRCVETFEVFYQTELPWLQCSTQVSGWGARRWWAVPQPTGRNRWYNEPGNAVLAGKLLARLRRPNNEQAA